MTYPRLGISNVLPSDTKVIYSRVPARGSVGRISDLFAHAAKHDYKQEEVDANATGILIHALLDAVFLLAKGSSIYVETAAGYEEALIAARYSIGEMIQGDDFPMGIDYWVKDQWANSSTLADLRHLLRPSDRIEARYNLKLKLLEWRVVRKLKLSVVSDAPTELVIIEDESEQIHQNSDLPKELSELPFNKWLEEVYKTSSKVGASEENSPDVYFQGGTQTEVESARVVAIREKNEVKTTLRKEPDQPEEFIEALELDVGTEADAEKADEVDETSVNIDETNEHAKAVVQGAKRRELRAKRELIVSQRKVEKLEALLHEKEKAIAKKTNELRTLNAKLMEKTAGPEVTESVAKFRDKALQMAEALKKAKDENDALEKLVAELRQKPRVPDAAVAESPSSPAKIRENNGPITVAQQQSEDMNRKLEAMSRALEAEKAKVTSLAERLTSAQKEAQSSAPIIEDLEKKVDHSLKVAQQHKKETESVKQKLVQSDAEKNRIKNELVKAQAQIQTLMKRQAS